MYIPNKLKTQPCIALIIQLNFGVNAHIIMDDFCYLLELFVYCISGPAYVVKSSMVTHLLTASVNNPLLCNKNVMLTGVGLRHSVVAQHMSSKLLR